ncbi:YqzK family protein [Bacillus solimangrovi]|uniref:DUF4227 domain-containing protein n=1 Tax=Bacillus solimangrovi TaxID=1305675 RepID=A0A1E5LHR0_9BACI|nr:YqzK family protein [Bacillus solimangrovi]OEH93598.1 hypothetical protein BFG57_01025 [Bacillus solimangrovi]
MKGIKIFLHAVKVFILFTGCTILFYLGMLWINEEYEDYHRYDQPQGNAMRVSGNFIDDAYPVVKRLIFFYEHGE